MPETETSISRQAGDGLYAHGEPFDQGELRVDDTHVLHYAQYGKPDGQPALFLHGGPGSGCSPRAPGFFDPDHYRVVCHDQRGCGRSRPHAALVDNTTQHLLADIERLRVRLGIERWLVFGGSWGSTLALAYAQAHPDRVDALVLRGIFFGGAEEIAWFYQGGCEALFPDAWEDYVAPIPPGERGDMVGAYLSRLTGDDEPVRLAAARAWSRWEGATSFLVPDETHTTAAAEDAFALARARIECHYFAQRCFLDDDALLQGIDRIRDIPATIVQGRYDVICPMRTAWRLHLAWPEAQWRLLADAGHSAFELPTIRALIEATDGYRVSSLARRDAPADASANPIS